MQPGSVIVDLAAEAGGNCELTEPGETVVERRRHDHRRRSTCRRRWPQHASQLYARTQSLVELLRRGGELALDFDDEIIAARCITHDGAVVHGAPRRCRRSRMS